MDQETGLIGEATASHQHQQLLQLLQQQHAEITSLRARIERQEANLAATQAPDRRVSNVSLDTFAEPASSSQNQSLIDTRTLGKPEVFKGQAEDFPEWVFVFKAYMGCIDLLFNSLLERAEGSSTPMVNRGLHAREEQLSNQLYFVLVMLLRGRALDVAYNVGSGEGLETYRKLYETFHPRVASRYVGSLSPILSTRLSSGDLEAELETFDKTVRRYESESGKHIDDELLLGIVVNGLQDTSMRDHVIRNSSRLRTYQDVRTELLEISRTIRVLSQMPFPMDIGAAPFKKGGKGKGKNPSKDGKGKDQKNRRTVQITKVKVEQSTPTPTNNVTTVRSGATSKQNVKRKRQTRRPTRTKVRVAGSPAPKLQRPKTENPNLSPPCLR